MKHLGKITLQECKSSAPITHFSSSLEMVYTFIFKLWNFRRCAPKGKVRVIFINHKTCSETVKFDCATIDLAFEYISRQYNAANRRGHFLICDEHAHVLQTRCC